MFFLGLMRGGEVTFNIGFERLENTRLTFAYLVQCGIYCDTVYPRIEAGGLLELVSLVPGVEQGILNRIGSHIGISRDFQARRIPTVRSG